MDVGEDGEVIQGHSKHFKSAYVSYYLLVRVGSGWCG